MDSQRERHGLESVGAGISSGSQGDLTQLDHGAKNMDGSHHRSSERLPLHHRTRGASRAAVVFLALSTVYLDIALATSTSQPKAAMQNAVSISEYPVVELRRYTTTRGDARRFAAYFDNYFPQAFQQLGAMVFGQFVERGRPDGFTWIRGYHEMSARPIINSAFYFGPVWKEHRSKVNAILPDSDNVLQLTPLEGMTPLPMIDPVDEASAPKGIAVIHLLPVRKADEATSTRVRELVGHYLLQGVQPLGLLVSLDEPNNFPQLPVRTDGPWIVWIGVVHDENALAQVREAAKAAEANLQATGSLRADAELLVLDPTPLSRMRWLDKDEPGP